MNSRSNVLPSCLSIRARASAKPIGFATTLVLPNSEAVRRDQVAADREEVPQLRERRSQLFEGEAQPRAHPSRLLPAPAAQAAPEHEAETVARPDARDPARPAGRTSGQIPQFLSIGKAYQLVSPLRSSGFAFQPVLGRETDQLKLTKPPARRRADMLNC